MERATMRRDPDARGYFGEFGGRFVPETLVAPVEELERALGTRVRIIELSEQRGRIEIEYYSQTDLDRLFQQITGGVN